MGRWDDGMMGRWDDGTMGRWDDGAMGRWDDGTMGRWDDGTIRCYRFHINFDRAILCHFYYLQILKQAGLGLGLGLKYRVKN